MPHTVYYETAEIETCAVAKDNFNSNFNVYSNISDAETLEIVAINAAQCLVRFSVHLIVWTGITGRNSLYADNGDQLLS